jgi:Predicted pyridoxal phosphate-dependent enzyme apparently involved in regulation of cell wall biogenesis
MAYDFFSDSRFEGLKPIAERTRLSTPTMHDGAELIYINEAYQSGWVTTVGENINELERIAAEAIGVNYAVALTCGTAAIHLAVKLAAERLYQSSTGVSTPSGKGYGGALFGKRVFVSDLTFNATVNPIVYEGGEPILIDSEYDTWNMDPQALEKAFVLYPDVKLVILVHLYGTPAKIMEIKRICENHGALLIEDAAESFGAKVNDLMTGSFGDYGVVSFNGNKIITGSSGGMLLVNDKYSADKARKWSTQSREDSPWYEHEELGYNYRISNIVAGIVRGQWPFLQEHIKQKKKIYDRYKEKMKDLPLMLNPVTSCSNYWLSCALINEDAMAGTARSGRQAIFNTEVGKSSPTEILEALNAFKAEGRPIWKPMHMQPIYAGNGFVTKNGNGRGMTDAYIKHDGSNISSDIFNRGLCLPSDNKMTEEQQDRVIEVVKRCFR